MHGIATQIDDPITPMKFYYNSEILSSICKLCTIDYLKKYHGVDIDEDGVYRYLDKLYNKQKDLVQQISYNHTLGLLNNQISIVFYDVTTLYFEIDDQDDLRRTGFSKEGIIMISIDKK